MPRNKDILCELFRLGIDQTHHVCDPVKPETSRKFSLSLQTLCFSADIFTHSKLRLAHAIHNFKRVKIIDLFYIEGQLFLNSAAVRHISHPARSHDITR